MNVEDDIIACKCCGEEFDLMRNAWVSEYFDHIDLRGHCGYETIYVWVYSEFKSQLKIRNGGRS